MLNRQKGRIGMHQTSDLSNGFSRTEVMLALALLILLVIIMVPAFITCRCSPISRTKGNLRALSSAIESYHYEHGTYPAMVPLQRSAKDKSEVHTAKKLQLTTVELGQSEALPGLTTPVAFIRAIPLDEYTVKKAYLHWRTHNFERRGALPYGYFTDLDNYLIYSAGPNRVYDINPALDCVGGISVSTDTLRLRAYDPTNGIESGGDLIRTAFGPIE